MSNPTCFAAEERICLIQTNSIEIIPMIAKPLTTPLAIASLRAAPLTQLQYVLAGQTGTEQEGCGLWLCLSL